MKPDQPNIPQPPAEPVKDSLASPICSEIVRALRAHIAHMAPHHRERQGGKLIIASYNEIVRLREALSALVAAEEATIDKFDAEEIEQMELALAQAKAALSPNVERSREG